MVTLKNINIDFDCKKVTPYFQVTSEQRIRFGMEDLNITLLRKIVEDIFRENESLSVIFLSEYITHHKRYSSKSKIGKIIKIKNWHEIVVMNEAIGEGEVYAIIKNLNCNDVMKYCSAIYKGHPEAYLSFLNDKFLFYINGDVIDIISHDAKRIAYLKQYYAKLYDKYYEDGSFRSYFDA